MAKPLSLLKQSELKQIALQTGQLRSLTRKSLLAKLRVQLATPQLGPVRKKSEHGKPSGNRADGPRIISIDMGIRNLAYCVLDVPSVQCSDGGNGRPGSLCSISPRAVSLASLVHWERISLSPSSSSAHSTHVNHPNVAPSFTPESLSRTAYKLLSNSILPFQPTHILIERQRQRSKSSPAVSEWVFRVNLFEGMIWAVLETLRCQHKMTKEETGSPVSDAQIEDQVDGFPRACTVDPQRVGAFWTSRSPIVGDSLDFAQSIPHQKVDKEVKIAIVESFLRPKDAEIEGGSSLHRKSDDIGSLQCSTMQACRMRDMFLAARTKKKEKRKTRRIEKGSLKSSELEEKDDDGEELQKLDDLSDCLLQGLAWIQWEVNRQSVLSKINLDG